MSGYDRWDAHLPDEEELRQYAIAIFFHENPHATTPPEDYELSPPEGTYYLKARARIMSGYIIMFERALQAYKEEIEMILEKLRQLDTPHWQPNLKVFSKALTMLEESIR